MTIDLYYERRFDPKGGHSWSGSFRPDYTLVMYPTRLKSENEAATQGKLSFLHFDAKYRAEKIGDVFGDWLKEDEGEYPNEKEPETDNRSYKKDDLLKMHTYNDAIRRTAGSFVLYPGSDKEQKPKERFHEILPGVGAFVLKPGNPASEVFLKKFLLDVFTHQSDRFTQFQYLADATHQTISDGPKIVNEAGRKYTVTRESAPCVVHWMRKKDEKIFRDGGFAYCHAIYRNDANNETKLQLDLSAEIGSEFIPCLGGQGKPLITAGWRGKITGVKFLTAGRLAELLSDRGLNGRPSSTRATHYLYFEFDENADFPKYNITEVAKQKQSGSQYMAFSCRWADLICCRAV